MELKRGDIFLSKNPMWLGRIINLVQKFWSVDGKSKYSHGGIIIDKDGNTLEALWTVTSQNFYQAYDGSEVLVARHRDMNYINYEKGRSAIKKHIGQWYPFHRLLFYIIPPVAKYVTFGRVVCTELMNKFIKYSVDPTAPYRGISPDNAHDLIKNSKDWTIIYEGVIK